MGTKDEFPEDGFVLGMVLLLELIYSLSRDSIFLSTHNSNGGTCEAYENVTSFELLDETLDMYRNETRGNGLGEILIFSAALMILVSTFTMVIVLYALSACQTGNNTAPAHHSPLLTLFSCGKHEGNNFADHSHMSYIASLVQCLLVALYFIGDNLGPLILKHGEELGCVGQCSKNIVITTKVISVATPLLLHLVPHILHHCVKSSTKLEYVIEDEKKLLGLLGVIVKVDAAYTAMTGFIRVAGSCSGTEEALNWVVLTFCAIGGAVYITSKIINAKGKLTTCVLILLTVFSFFNTLILLFLYLTSDNGTPLDCSFHCDANGPSGVELSHPLLDRHCCNIHSNVVTRLVFTVIVSVQSLAIAAIVAVELARAQGKAKKNSKTQSSPGNLQSAAKKDDPSSLQPIEYKQQHHDPHYPLHDVVHTQI